MDTGFSISFQTKIALLAGAITGCIVLGACSLLWNMTYRFNQESLDRDVLNIAQGNMQRLVGRQHWERLDESLSYVSSEADEGLSFCLLAESRGRREYVSKDWPKSLRVGERFPIWKDRRNEVNPPRPPNRDEPISERNPALKVIDWSFVNEYANGTLWRVGVFDNFYGNLVIAVDLDSFDARMDRLKSRYYFVAPLALVLAFSGAWFVAKRSLRPVEKLTLAVEGLSAERLDERIEEVGHEKEFQRLLGMFNEMVARLGKSFHQARRFSADASHELKTPLARLQMELEVALKEADLGSKEQVTYSNLLDEMARLGGVVDKLTLLSSSDAGKLEVSLSDVNLSEVLENVVEDCEAMSEGRCFELSIEPGVSVQADRVLLEQALQNVCSNALKHGSRNGVVKISLRQNLGRKIVEIANEGKAIPEAEWEQVFERFYQRDFSRSEQAGGVGLGLSLSREITRAHGGDLKLIRSDGDWTVFEFVL